MQIGIVGASGKAGRFVLEEAVSRGHEVTAIVRDATKLAHESVSVLEKNVFDLTTKDLSQFDVVVNAFGAPLGEEQPHIDAGRALIHALAGTKTRLLVVGGAGSLYADSSKTIKVMDTLDFPNMFKPTARGQSQNLEELRTTTDVLWTFLSPAAFFDSEGKRTGAYKIGNDVLLANAKGESYISYADFAIAVVDEIENPKHVKERFTVVAEAQ